MKRLLLLMSCLLLSCAATRNAEEMAVCLGFCATVKFLEVTFKSDGEVDLEKGKASAPKAVQP
jgi:hypothetical protein